MIALIAISSALAGAAIDRIVIAPMTHRHAGPPPFRTPEQDQKRREDMLARMTKELSLSDAQRASIDSVMRRTDSSFHAIRLEMQPRLTKVFTESRADIIARLDSTQRVKFAKDTLHRGRRGGGP